LRAKQTDFYYKTSVFIRVHPWLKLECAALLFAFFALSFVIFVYQLDEYLQATLVVIELD